MERTKQNEKCVLEALLSVREAAAVLGMAEHTVYNKIGMRALPYVRVDRSVRFRQSDLRTIIDSGFVPAREAK